MAVLVGYVVGLEVVGMLSAPKIDEMLIEDGARWHGGKGSALTVYGLDRFQNASVELAIFKEWVYARKVDPDTNSSGEK
jgi:hypothetical protein